MRSHDPESGFALILLIGITAALAILAAVLVMMLDNQQQSTFKERTNKQNLSYSEAALDSALLGVEGDNSWLTTPFTTTAEQTEMGTYFTAPAGAIVALTLAHDLLQTRRQHGADGSAFFGGDDANLAKQSSVNF